LVGNKQIDIHLKLYIMKKIFTILFTVLTGCVFSQNYWDYNINFEDTSQIFRLEIDTVSNHNNIWQIGNPQKTVFTSAYSVPNAIVTDTMNSYPTNDTSVFIIKHVADQGFEMHHTVILSGKYKVNSDSLSDYGIIEFSPDNGNIWVNLLTDTFYLNLWCYEWPWDKPTLTGNSNGWVDFYAYLANFSQYFPISYGDTVQYRFTFISDSVQTNKDGLMFDDLHFEDWAEGINEVNTGFTPDLFPNPASDLIYIQADNSIKISSVTIRDIQGRTLLITDKTTVDLSEFAPGVLLFELNTDKGRIFKRVIRN
jgi:hypothetical protein